MRDRDSRCICSRNGHGIQPSNITQLAHFSLVSCSQCDSDEVQVGFLPTGQHSLNALLITNCSSEDAHCTVYARYDGECHNVSP